MKNRNSSARTKAEKSTKAEVTTSSQNNAKPNVICSQSKLYPFKLENEFLLSKVYSTNFIQWSKLALALFENVENFYSWFNEKYKSKDFPIVLKIKDGCYYIDESQMRKLHSSLLSLEIGRRGIERAVAFWKSFPKSLKRRQASRQ